mgnify:CR=1 FL=1
MAGFNDLSKEETLTCAGEAASVMDADRLAWEALESVLGPDPLEAWTLVKMVHAVKERGKISWQALFHRDPEHPSPPNLQPVAAEQITDASAFEQKPVIEAPDEEDALNG